MWAVSQQVVTLAFTGVFSIVLVRFVSVSEFGIYSYAVTLASLGIAVMASGLQGLAIRELRTRGDDAPRILASLFFIREVMALVVYVAFAVYTLTASDLRGPRHPRRVSRGPGTSPGCAGTLVSGTLAHPRPCAD